MPEWSLQRHPASSHREPICGRRAAMKAALSCGRLRICFRHGIGQLLLPALSTLDFGLWTFDCGEFPPVMNPEPIGGITAYGRLKGSIHICHDGFGGAGYAIVVSLDFAARFDAPAP